MIGKNALSYGVLSILFTLAFFTIQAQPLLPDMAGITDKGVNIITWTCQYDGIKSIAVQRSTDSQMNFYTVGYVKNLKKGVQVFADGHPLAGNNYYQLLIVFSSDLSWSSNHIKLFVDSNVIRKQRVKLPSNDSLQKYISTSAKKFDDTKAQTPIITKEEPYHHQKLETKHPIEIGSAIDIDKAPNVVQLIKPDSLTTTEFPRNPPPKKRTIIVVATKDDDMVTSIDSTYHRAVAINDSLKKKQPKLYISLVADATVLDANDYIKSQYVFTDPISGNINITLPEVSTRSYSMRIYNQSNKVVFDIPRLSVSPVIMDKRNFHKGGMYKFVLKRDNKEFETGFLNITLE